MTTCPYFHNLKFDVFDAVFVSATLPRLDCVQADFHVSTEVQNSFLIFLFLPLLFHLHSTEFHFVIPLAL